MGNGLGRLVMAGAAALVLVGCVYDQRDSVSSSALHGSWIGPVDQPSDAYLFQPADDDAGDRFELYRYDLEGRRELVRTGRYRVEQRTLLVPRGAVADILITEVDWDADPDDAVVAGTEVEQTITNWSGDSFELGSLLIDSLPRTYRAIDALP